MTVAKCIHNGVVYKTISSKYYSSFLYSPTMLHNSYKAVIFTLTLQAMSAQNLPATYSVPMVPVCVLCGDYDPGKVAGELRPEQQQTVPGGGGGGGGGNTT